MLFEVRTAANALSRLLGTHLAYRTVTWYAFAALALAGAGVVRSQEDLYQPAPAFRSLQGYIALRGGLAYTDNALLTTDNQVQDTLVRTGFDIDYSRRGSMLDLDARGSVDSVEYLKHTFDRSTYGTLNASALWGHSTDLFQWLVRDTLGEVTADPFGAPTPANLETVNYLTTGPFLNFRLGEDNRLSLFGSYSKTDYQRSPYDSHSIAEGVSIAHDLSLKSSIALQANGEQFDFNDQTAATNYKLHSVSVRYAGTLARTEATLEAGYAWLHQESMTTGGPLLTFQLDRRISYSTTVYLRARSQYSSAAESIRAEMATPLMPGAIPGIATAAPYTDRSLGLGWTFARARTTFSFLGTVDRESYVGQSTFDRRDTYFEGLFERHLRPTISAKVMARQTYQKFANIDADIAESLVNLSLSKEFRRTGVNLYYERRHHTASGASSSLVTAFDENQVGLNLTYDIVGQHP
ncbi:MAG: hypothetical protein ACRETG_00260 [Steroidobacteraceae bacterium]